VDEDRIQEVGPDRAAAEWILKNGGGVKWSGKDRIDDNYDSLVSVGKSQRITEIDGTQSSISHYGFQHLKGLTRVEKITLSNNAFINDDALSQLSFVKETLKALEVSYCVNVTDSGVKSLAQLSNLQSLKLRNLMNVKDLKSCVTHVSKSVPGCRIESDSDVISDKKQ
jgi:H+-transporting ATP synthase F0 complex subunit s